jgi:hypothetical protein
MDNLTTYLTDHLAGSVGALELIDRLIETYEEKPLGHFLKELRDEIAEDQGKLENLIANLGQNESTVRKAGAWIMEKFSRAKIQLSDSCEGEMGLFQALEGLVLGITGKRALWRALAEASTALPQLRGLDYTQLEKRAVDQCDRVEARRLEVAREVFVSGEK